MLSHKEGQGEGENLLPQFVFDALLRPPLLKLALGHHCAPLPHMRTQKYSSTNNLSVNVCELEPRSKPSPTNEQHVEKQNPSTTHIWNIFDLIPICKQPPSPEQSLGLEKMGK